MADHSESGGSVASRHVELDGRLAVLTLIATLFFIWPLLAYGRPGYIPDSAAYYKGGRAAVTHVLGPVQGSNMNLAPAKAASSAIDSTGRIEAPSGAGGSSEVRGSRAVAYSLAAYILRAPDPAMWLLAAAQALAAGFLSAVTLLLFTRDTRKIWWKLAFLAIATPVAFVSGVIVPDIFAGLVILVIALIATEYARMSNGVRAASVAIAAAGITFHASHLPLGLTVTLSALAVMALMRDRQSIPPGQWALVLSPFMLGAAATIALNLVAFGGPSLTGKRYPLTLARSVANGPGKWYLEKNCSHLKFAVCEVFPDRLPDTVNGFLWGEGGVKERATPEQLDRIRAEESEVVLAAARAYPLHEIGQLAENFAKQLILFEPGLGLESKIGLDADRVPVLQPAPYSKGWIRLVHLLTMVSVTAGTVLLYRRLRSDQTMMPIVAIVVAGLVLNAAICVFFSGVTDRYQARVIWLIPLLALAALGRTVPRGAATPAASR